MGKAGNNRQGIPLYIRTPSLKAAILSAYYATFSENEE